MSDGARKARIVDDCPETVNENADVSWHRVRILPLPKRFNERSRVPRIGREISWALTTLESVQKIAECMSNSIRSKEVLIGTMHCGADTWMRLRSATPSNKVLPE